MKPHDIINSEHPKRILIEVKSRLHIDGPVEQEDLETLAYLKRYHPNFFAEEESQLMYLLGLFYKTGEPKDILSLAYSIFGNAIQDETNQRFTPVQASIRTHILQNRYFSFSAPTSAGKSFLFRELIKDQHGDVVIVVPSRALIAEYMLAVIDLVSDRKDILVLQFIDNININKTSRRIFIVTPERASEILKYPDIFNVSIFLYDEAQISEEKVRGVSFDALVRRVEKVFPGAKKVFAHPFVLNPEAQFKKHGIIRDAGHMAYCQNSVGKLYLTYNIKSGVFEHFSPFIQHSHLKNNKMALDTDIPAQIISSGGSILVYISKASIYDKSFKSKFKYYISLCEVITNPVAIAIVKEVKSIIGALGKQSEMVELMRYGVVIHHGSIPLSVRFLIEKFTNNGFAKICFATSTLAQGVNMPFDLVWVDNLHFTGSEENKTLGLKNLIGRAGRNTSVKNQFDCGYVVVNNVKTFVKRFNGPVSLSEISRIDDTYDDNSAELAEYVEAIKNDTIDDEYNLPESKLERLRSSLAKNHIRTALHFLFNDGEILTGNQYRSLSKPNQDAIKNSLKSIFEISLGRVLLQGEQSILSTAISILLWQIQGKSFRELLGYRYSYLTKRTEWREIRRRFLNHDMSKEEFYKELINLKIRYTPMAEQLPKSTAKYAIRRFRADESVIDLNYDLLVYDTYDYVDKVISFSLSDIYVAAFGEFYYQTEDERSLAMVNYFRYKTNNPKEILLLRYGFSFEDIDLISEYVSLINENEIVFSNSISALNGTSVMSQIKRYI